MYLIPLVLILIGNAAAGKYYKAKCPEDGIGYPGNDIGAKKDGVKTWQKCGELCSSTAGCLFFTYTPTKKKCSLKSSGISRKVAKNKVSGPRGCPAPKGSRGYVEIGCFKDQLDRAITGVMSQYNTDVVIQKCYLRAIAESNTYFAVQNNVQCFTSSSAAQTYNRYGEGVGCVNGKGGGWLSTVYKVTKNPLSGRPFTSVGCWKDNIFARAIPGIEGKDARLDGSYAARKNAVQKCFEAAQAKGYKFFALQNGGWCASSSIAESRYKMYLKADVCRDGRGGPSANDVYKIKGGNNGHPTPNPNPKPVVAVYANYKDKQCKDIFQKFQPRGCYNSNKYLVRGKMLVNWRYDIEWAKDRIPKFAHSLVCACAEVAKAARVSHFGTHFWGECFALKLSQVTEAPNGDCTLADGEYKTKCTSKSGRYANECLGVKSYYVYNVLHVL